MILINSQSLEGAHMQKEELKERELELLKLAELDPSDVIWTQRWTEGVQVIRQKMKEE